MGKKIKLNNAFKTYSGLPREIYILFVARVINCIGNFVYPFLTFFLKDKLGMSTKEIGMTMTIYALYSGLGSIIGGKLSDNKGRKKIMILCQGAAALNFIICGIIDKPKIILKLLLLNGLLGGAAHPPNGAMIQDLTNKENRKQAYSLLYLGINIGVAIGPLIAGFLYNNYMRVLFIGDGITTIISLILVGIYVKESLPDIDNKSYIIHDDEKAEKGFIFAVIFKRPILVIFTLISVIYSFIYAQCGYIIPIQVKNLFGINGSKFYGTLMSVNALTVVCFTTVITAFTKKNKSVFNIALGGLFYSIGFGMLAFIKSYSLFIISTVIWTIGEILCSTNSGVFIANHTPMSHRGRFNAILPIITGAGSAIAPYIMGMYISNNGFCASWIMIFVLAVISSALMYMLHLKERKTCI